MSDARSNEELVESERLFRLLVENSSDWIVHLAPDFTILYSSPACRAVLGYEPHDVVGKSLRSFFSDVYDVRRILGRERVRSQESDYTVENLFRRRDGSVVWTESTVRARLDPVTGEILELFASIRDVSERNALKEELQRFFALSTDMLAMVQNGHFERVNPAWSHVLGYSERELSSRPVLDFCHVADRERTRAGFAPEGELGAATFESRWTCKDGSTRWLAWNVVAAAYGAPILYVVARDVTARKAVDAMKDDFVTAVSHELRTPLTAMHGSIALLASGVLGELPARAAEAAQIARGNSERLVALVNRILQFESGDGLAGPSSVLPEAVAAPPVKATSPGGHRVDFVAEMAALRDEYRAVLPARAAELATLVLAALAAPGEAARLAARSAAHRLGGTAGSYGFTTAGEAASDIEVELDRLVSSETHDAAAARIRDLLARLDAATREVEP
jgi:PAS domain S-box-containing protein